MDHIEIQSINLIDEHIAVLFEKEWFQEDILMLSKLLLGRLASYQIKENTLGADRENIRFLWLNAEFTLNFDYYSQSCWFNAQDELSTKQINALFNTLVKS